MWRLAARWLAWLRDPVRAERSRARALLRDLFDRPELLRATSLGRQHRGRVMYLDHAARDGRVERVTFSIVRHPRPYPFSRQYHEVLEVWTYDVSKREVRRERGVNLSRRGGGDGAPPGFGPDV